MTSMYDRWADDDKAGGGLVPGNEPLPLPTEALGLSIQRREHDPWNRYLKAVEAGDEALAKWEVWMREYLRRRAREAEE